MLQLRQMREALHLGEEPLHRGGIGRVCMQQLDHDGGAVGGLRQPGSSKPPRPELVHELAPGDVALAQVRARLGRDLPLAGGAEGLVRDVGREGRRTMRALRRRRGGA